MSWSKALEIVCEHCLGTETEGKWIIVGSVASVLQGAVMAPQDLDLYVRSAEDAVKLASMLEPLSLIHKSVQPHGAGGWLSSAEEPLYTQSFASGFTWTKGKWVISGFEVELVHISDSAGIPDSEDGAGIWEGGPSIWRYARQLPWAGYPVSVVPLEIQLESNLRRQRADRVEAILRAFKDIGYDRSLLQKALSRSSRRIMEEIPDGQEYII